MEDIGQIILVVIALIGAVAQQAAKAKKAKEKKQAHNSTPSYSDMPDNSMPDEDPFSWLMRTGVPKPAAEEIHEYGYDRAAGTAHEEFYERNAHDDSGAGRRKFLEDANTATRPADEYFSYDNAFSESIYELTGGKASLSGHPEYYGGVEGGRTTSALPDPVAAKAGLKTADFNRITTGTDSSVDDFDLRRAVIYSEILKAKYQDY
jgi:hypothetical protein